MLGYAQSASSPFSPSGGSQFGSLTSSAPSLLARPPFAVPSALSIPASAPLVGWAPATRAGPGTSAPRFEQTPEAGGNGSLIQSIGAMPAYAAWSQDELRWEDYQLGRNHPAPLPQGVFAAFSRPAFQTPPPALSQQPLPSAASMLQPSSLLFSGVPLRSPFVPSAAPVQPSGLSSLLRAPQPAHAVPPCATPPPAPGASTVPASLLMASHVPPVLAANTVVRSASHGLPSDVPELVPSMVSGTPQVSPVATAVSSVPLSPLTTVLLPESASKPYGDVPEFPKAEDLRSATPPKSEPLACPDTRDADEKGWGYRSPGAALSPQSPIVLHARGFTGPAVPPPSPSRKQSQQLSVAALPDVSKLSLEESLKPVVSLAPAAPVKSVAASVPPSPNRAAMQQRRKSSTSRPTGAPKLTKPQYYTEPPMHELALMDDLQLSSVIDFTVGCVGLGSVRFSGATDIRGLDLDALVEISPREIAVYPDDTNKPPVGRGLNKQATLRIASCFPKERADPTAIERYRATLISVTADMGAAFISYSSESGEWVFRVDHFTRYGLTADLEDDEGDSDSEVDEAEAIEEVSSGKGLQMESGGEECAEEIMDDEELSVAEEPEKEVSVDEDVMAQEDELEEDERRFAARRRVSAWQTSPQALYESSAFATSTASALPQWEPLAARPKQPQQQRQFPTTSTALPAHSAPSSRLSLRPRVSLVNAQPVLVVRAAERPSLSAPVPVPLSESRLHSAFGISRDPSMALARSFRVGFGPNGLIALPRLIQGRGCIVSTRNVQYEPAPDKHACVQYLKVHLQYNNGGYGTPYMIASPEKLISAIATIAEREDAGTPESTHFKLIWKLMSALWCPDDRCGSGPVPAPERRAALDSWLREAIAPTVEDRARKAAESGNHLAEAFVRLAGGQVSRATDCVLKAGKPRIAAVVAQADGDPAVREDATQQLKSWDALIKRQAMPEDVIRLFRLVAGQVDHESVCSGLGWLECLGLHMWHRCNRSASARDVIDSFCKAVDNKSATSPVTATGRTDTLYELLRLYANPGYPLGTVVHPQGHSSSPMDHSLSWMLLTVLQAIDNNRPSLLADEISVSYAEQLEAAGLWQWSAYVLLHLRDRACAERAVSRIISAHVGMSADEEESLKERFVIKDLMVPDQMVSLFKAWRCHDQREHWKELAHLQDAGAWPEAHELATGKLAAGAIIADRLFDLQPFLEAAESHRDAVPLWAQRGETLLAYLRLQTGEHLFSTETEHALDSISTGLGAWRDRVSLREKALYDSLRAMAKRECNSTQAVEARVRGRGALSLARREMLTERACIAKMARKIIEIIATWPRTSGITAGEGQGPGRVMALLRTCPVSEDVLLECASNTLSFLV